MRLIGITGKSHAGKGVIAAWLVRHRGAIEEQFSRPLKQAISAMLGTSSRIWDEDQKEAPLPNLGVSPRRLAQTLGTEWGRNTVDKDFWVKVAALRLGAAGLNFDSTATVAYSDMRFDNEAEWIRSCGGLVLHVRRDGADGNVGIQGHASEAGITAEAGDILIENNGTIDDLHGKLGAIFPQPPIRAFP